MRKLAALTLLVSLYTSTAFAGGQNDAAPQPAKPRHTRKAPAVNKTEKFNAEVAAKLEELRQTLVSQQQELQLLKEELGKRDREIEEARTAAATANSHAAEARAAAADAANAASTVKTEVAASISASELQAGEQRKKLDEKIAAGNKSFEEKIKKVGPFSFAGDFRLRDEPFFGGPVNNSQVRNRERFRLRFTANVKLNDDISGGFALASGDINDPISTNQTANQYYTRKPFLLDRAFINYTPHQLKALTLTGGKFAYPFYRTELVWDNDLNPEGLAEKLEWKGENWKVLKQFAVIGFQLPFAETSGVNFNLPNTNNRSIHQSVVYGGQVQTAWQLGSWAKLTLDAAYYDYHNPDPIAFSIATVNASSPSLGLLRLGGSSFQNSYQTATVSYIIPVDNGLGGTTGTTTVNSTIVNAKLNSGFGLFDTIAQLDFKTPSPRVPVRLLGDYVQNTKACQNAGNPIFVPTEPANATVTIATVNKTCNSRQRRGYWLEARVGRQQLKGDFQVAYTRMFVEREAVMSAFNFSDMRQNSNVSEHRVELFYQALNNIQLGFTGLFGRPLNFGLSTPPEPMLKRLQFDVIYKF